MITYIAGNQSSELSMIPFNLRKVHLFSGIFFYFFRWKNRDKKLLKSKDYTPKEISYESFVINKISSDIEQELVLSLYVKN